jgi:hypothetical protein
MDLITMFVIVAMLAAVGAMVFGVSAMDTGGEVGHWSSIQWMTWRVGLQAVAFLLTLLAIFDMR